MFYFLVLAIFGNKVDLQTVVSEAEVREYAKSVNAVFGRTSALTGNGIQETINKLISKFLVEKNNLGQKSPGDKEKNENIVIDEKKQKQNIEKKSCC